MSDDLPAPDHTALHTAIGRLIICFSYFEGSLAAHLRLHLAANMPYKTAQDGTALAAAIYGSMRMKTARDTIKRICAVEETPEPVQQFVDDVFSHVGHIEKLRDLLAHQAVLPTQITRGRWVSSDLSTTKTLRQIKYYSFTTEAVIAASLDLEVAMIGLAPKKLKGPKLFEDGFLDLSPLTCRYKQAMLKLEPLGKAPFHQ
jgi:hypothetical protein